MTARPTRCPSLSIVLPCLDEADRLPGTLAAYLAHFPPSRAEVELIVVDDGSSDGTSTIADQIAAADPRVRGVRTPHNHGKGYAVRVGVQAAQGELVVFTDADGSYGPEQLERVVAALDRLRFVVVQRDLLTEQDRELLERLQTRQGWRTLLDRDEVVVLERRGAAP